MDIWFLVAVMAVILTSLQLIPQVYKSLKTGKVRDLSLGWIILIILVSTTWLAYGIHLGDWAIKVANSINLVGALVLFVLKVSTKASWGP